MAGTYFHVAFLQLKLLALFRLFGLIVAEHDSDGAGDIQIFQPNASSSFLTDGTIYCSWNTSTVKSSYVHIYLYQGEDNYIQTLDSYHAAYSGEESASITADPEPGTDYRVKIVDTSDSSYYGWSQNFTIDCPLTVYLYDSYGDGWNGNKFGFYLKNDTDSALETVTLASGSSGSECLGDATPRQCYLFDLYQTGSYTGEISWSLCGETGSYSSSLWICLNADGDCTVYYEEIEVTSPSAGDYYTPGDEMYVSWATTDLSSSYVKLLLYENDTLAQTLYSYQYAPTGYKYVSLSDGLGPSSLYSVRVQDYYDSIIRGDSGTFTVGVEEIEVNTPDGTESYSRGGYITVSWDTTELSISSSYLSGYLYKDDTYVQELFTWVSAGYGSTSTYLDSTLDEGSDYWVLLEYAYDSDIYGVSSYFTITTQSITVYAPYSSDVYYPGDYFYTSWETSGLSSSYVDINLYLGNTWVQTLSSYNYAYYGYQYAYLSSYLEESSSNYWVRVSDSYDSLIYGDSANFTIQSGLVISYPSSGSVYYNGDYLYVSYSIYGSSFSPSYYWDLSLYKGGVWAADLDQNVYESSGYLYSYQALEGLDNGVDYQVKITDSYDSSIYAYSDEFWIGYQGIVVTKPSSSSSYSSGDAIAVAFQFAGLSGSYVDVQLYRGDAWAQTLDNPHYVGSSSGSTDTTFELDGYLPTSSQYRVIVYDYYDSGTYGESDYFTIESPAIAVHVDNGTIYNPGDILNVSWSYTSLSGSYVDVALYTKEGELAEVLGSFEWAAARWAAYPLSADLEDGAGYRVKVSDAYESAHYAYSQALTIETPRLMVSHPDGSLWFLAGDPLMVAWTHAGLAGPDVIIYLYADGSYTETLEALHSADDSPVFFNLSLDLQTSDSYQVVLMDAQDLSLWNASNEFVVYHSAGEIEGVNCPAGWEGFGLGCYKSFENASTWENAEAHCQEEGGFLTSVDQQAVNYMNANNVSNMTFWMGLYDEDPTETFTFRWSDGTAVWANGTGPGAVFWNSTSMTNRLGAFGSAAWNASCGAHRVRAVGDHVWYNTDCGRALPYVCELDKCVAPGGYYCDYNATNTSAAGDDARRRLSDGDGDGKTATYAVVACTDGDEGGWYCPYENMTMAFECPAGFYCPAGAQEDRKSCTPGHYCPSTGLAAMEDCGAGRYCPNYEMKAPLNCTAGHYCPGSTESGPTQCNGGYYCPRAGLSSPEGCVAGTYCPRGSVAPTVCGRGSYCPADNAAAATDCPEGYRCPSSGMVAALDCGAGSYCPLGSTNATECESGHYCPTDNEADQTSCDPGYYCPDYGMTSPLECGAGYYCVSGADTQTICPAGYYCSGNNNSNPTACEQGYYCPDTGLLTPYDCGFGYYCGHEALTYNTMCTAGSYCDGTNAVSSTVCPTGSICPSDGLSAPEDCPGGYYCSSEGLTEGVICNSGYYCPSGSSEETVCETDYYCLEGSEAQTSCFDTCHPTGAATCDAATGACECQGLWTGVLCDDEQNVTVSMVVGAFAFALVAYMIMACLCCDGYETLSLAFSRRYVDPLVLRLKIKSVQMQKAKDELLRKQGKKVPERDLDSMHSGVLSAGPTEAPAPTEVQFLSPPPPSAPALAPAAAAAAERSSAPATPENLRVHVAGMPAAAAAPADPPADVPSLESVKSLDLESPRRSSSAVEEAKEPSPEKKELLTSRTPPPKKSKGFLGGLIPSAKGRGSAAAAAAAAASPPPRSTTPRPGAGGEATDALLAGAGAGAGAPPLRLNGGGGAAGEGEGEGGGGPPARAAEGKLDSGRAGTGTLVASPTPRAAAAARGEGDEERKEEVDYTKPAPLAVKKQRSFFERYIWKPVKLTFVVGGVVLAGYFADFSTMLANVILIVKGVKGVMVNWDYDNHFAAVVASLERFLSWFSPNLSFFATFYASCINFFKNFDIEFIPLDTMNVTCDGAQAPGKLFGNILILIFVAVLFESKIFAFLMLSLKASLGLLKYQLKLKGRPFFVILLITNSFMFFDFIFRYIVQLLATGTVVKDFVASGGRHINNENCGYLDLVFAVLATLAAYLLIFPTMHIMFRTFIAGLPENADFPYVEKRIPRFLRLIFLHPSVWRKQLKQRGVSGHQLATLARQASVRGAGPNKKYLELPSFFEMIILFTRSFCVMDFRIWRTYAYCMFWKVTQLMKMTAGIWDKDGIRGFGVTEMVDRYSVDLEDRRKNHQDAIVCTGMNHSMIWQFVPAFVVAAKYGEASNKCPLFVHRSGNVKPLLCQDDHQPWTGNSPKEKVKSTLKWLLSCVKGRFLKWLVYMLSFLVMCCFALKPDPAWLGVFAIVVIPLRVERALGAALDIL